MARKVICLSLPPDMVDAVDKQSKKTQMSRSAYMKNVLTVWLQYIKEANARKSTKK